MQFSWAALHKSVAVLLAISALAGSAYWWTGKPEIGLQGNRMKTVAGQRFAFFPVSTILLAEMVTGFASTEVPTPRSKQIGAWSPRLLACGSALAAILALGAAVSRKTGAANITMAIGLSCLAYSTTWLLVVTQDLNRAAWLFAHPSVGFVLGLIDSACWGVCFLMATRFFQRFPREIRVEELYESFPAWMKLELDLYLPKWRMQHASNLRKLHWAPLIFVFAYCVQVFSLPSTLSGLESGIDDGSVVSLVIIGALILLWSAPMLLGSGVVIGTFFYSWLYLRAGRSNCAPEEKRKSDWLHAAFLIIAIFIFSAVVGHMLIGFSITLTKLNWMVAVLVASGMIAVCIASFHPKRTTLPAAVRWSVEGGVGALFAVMYTMSADSVPAELLTLEAWVMPLAPPIFLIGLLAALGFSVFFKGAFEPSLLVRKTVLIGVVAVLMGGVIIILEHFAVGSILTKFGPEGAHGTTAILAGAFVTMGLHPLRHRLEHKITHLTDRLMPATVIAEGKRMQQVVAFSDLSSFTALSAADEQKALHVAGLFHKAARKIADDNHGRIVKTIGDAVLWVFPDVPSALRAVTVLHANFIHHCSAEGLSALSVHSGLHAGSVVIDRAGDVYGATVNLASRLQSLASDDQIVASEAVRSCSDATGYAFEPLGDQQLKNVPTPVACYLVRRVA